MAKRNTNVIWIKKNLKVEGKRTKTQEALVAGGGNFVVVVHRTLPTRVEAGDKPFTFKMVNLANGRETKRGTRVTVNAAKASAMRRLTRKLAA
jgi:hypothetical protein